MAEINLLPTPQFIERNSHDISLHGEFVVEIVTGPCPDPKVRLAARMIEEELGGAGRVVERKGLASGWIVLVDISTPGGQELSDADRGAIETFGQGYALRTREANRVCIWGRPQGLLWGAATLVQLLERNAAGLRVPGVYIRDFPHFDLRCAASWLTNAEANRHSMDRGQGWQAFEALCKRKIDQCLRFKINGILFDGFGWGLDQRPAEYVGVVRRINQYARQRGIHLSFGGYGAGYGMAFQKGPLYEDAQYMGQVFLNREWYPDGPVYPCTGETRAHAVRKGVDTRILGTCRSNEELNRLKAQEVQEFVRAVEPGMLYIHHEDYGSVRNTQAAWQGRCQRCCQRWPDDDATAWDGATGAIAEGYRSLIKAVNEVKNQETGYDGARDCQILLVSPVYCLSERTQESWDAALRFWQNVGRQLPAADNVMVLFREIFPFDGGPLWTESFNAAMREAGLDLGSIIFFITGGDQWLNDYPFVGASALNHLFAGARAIFHDNGNAYQEPLQALNAEYSWNVKSKGYAPRPGEYVKLWELWIGLAENEVRPPEIYGEGGLLRRACARLYGESIADIMARYFTVFADLQAAGDSLEGMDTHQDAAPERRSYLPMSPNKVHAVPVLWRSLALDSKTWGERIDNERMVAEMARLKIDRVELHRRLQRRWTMTRRMLETGAELLEQALAGTCSAAVQEDLRFLLDSAWVKIPLCEALARFHEALVTLVDEAGDRATVEPLLRAAMNATQEAAGLAERHWPAIVDPVGEPGAVKGYIARIAGAVGDYG